jgi:putative flavoprotein involved in K+ transport
VDLADAGNSSIRAEAPGAVADYLRGYAATFELPVRLNTGVTRLRQDGARYVAETATGTITARQVVVATGRFQTPHTPAVAPGLADDVVQVHSACTATPPSCPTGRSSSSAPPTPALWLG